VSKVSPVKALLICALAWLVPGAGHLVLGRARRALVFFGCLLALFVLGIQMDARLQSPVGLEDPLGMLRSVAQMAIGLPYLVARHYLGFEGGNVKAVLHEYGNTFTEVGGLLNILIMLDAYDTLAGRRP
jgi:uncharacterized protein DUF6677